MPQHDYNIANAPGATFRADINNVLAAIAGQNSGAAAPVNTFPYMVWADTTNNIVKIRNGTNTAWIDVYAWNDGNNTTTFMGGVNINGLTEKTTPASADTVPIYDVSGGANKKLTLSNLLKVISLLTEKTAPVDGDPLLLYDTSGSSPKRVAFSNLLKIINALTEDTTPDSASDYVVTYDASAAGAKKVKINNLATGLPAADQAAMEAATAITSAVTPGRQHHHPAHPKAVVSFTCSFTNVSGSVSSIDLTNDVVTFTSHGLATGDFVYLSGSGTWPTGVTAGQGYYVRIGDQTDSNTADKFRFYMSYSDAVNGTNRIDMSGTTGGNRTINKFTPIIHHSYGLAGTMPLRPLAGAPLYGPDGNMLGIDIILANAASSVDKLFGIAAGQWLSMINYMIFQGETTTSVRVAGTSTVDGNWLNANGHRGVIILYGDH